MNSEIRKNAGQLLLHALGLPVNHLGFDLTLAHKKFQASKVLFLETADRLYIIHAALCLLERQSYVYTIPGAKVEGPATDLAIVY